MSDAKCHTFSETELFSFALFHFNCSFKFRHLECGSYWSYNVLKIKGLLLFEMLNSYYVRCCSCTLQTMPTKCSNYKRQNDCLRLVKATFQITGSHSPSFTEQPWADWTRLPLSFLWQSEITLGCKEKKSPPKCSTLKPLKHVFLKRPCHLFLIYPLIPSSVVSTPPDSVRRSAGLRFPNLSLPPPPPPPFSPVLGPLCRGNPLFPLCPRTHCTHMNTDGASQSSTNNDRLLLESCLTNSEGEQRHILKSKNKYGTKPVGSETVQKLSCWKKKNLKSHRVKKYPDKINVMIKNIDKIFVFI